jgi:hypothetical protein
MGVLTSEVGYSSATVGRGDMECVWLCGGVGEKKEKEEMKEWKKKNKRKKKKWSKKTTKKEGRR